MPFSSITSDDLIDIKKILDSANEEDLCGDLDDLANKI